MTSPRDSLWVDPEHLRELADRQGLVAENIASAAGLCAGEAANVTRTHGVVCASTSTAAAAAAAARANACAAVQTMSEAFAANLETAATKYTRTDQDSGGNIDGTMRPGHR